MLTTGNFRDWCAIVQHYLVLKVSVDGHSELVQYPLQHVQPMQISIALYTTLHDGSLSK